MLFFVLLFFLLPKLAYCYLDPGTGTALINIVIAGGVALTYSLKGIFIKLIRKENKETSKTINRRETKKISIFSEGKQYWNSYKTIINELIESKITFYYYTLDIEDPALTIESKYMISKFLGYGIGQKANFMTIKSDILLTTTTNIGVKGYLPKPKKVKKMIHFFHSVCDISMYKKYSLDSYDAVFMAGNFQQKSIREIENKRNTKRKKLISLGLPYLDDLLENKYIPDIKEDTKTILIGSSWGEKGLLNYYGTDFIKQISELDYKIIIRPHPQSLKTEKSLIKNCMNELKGIQNVVWDETVDPTISMGVSDLLISDTSSIRYDYAFIYGKPVITLDIPVEAMQGYEREDLESIWSDEASSSIGLVLNNSEMNDLKNCVLKTFEEFDKSRLQTIRNTTVSHFGHSAEAYVKQLQSEIMD